MSDPVHHGAAGGSSREDRRDELGRLAEAARRGDRRAERTLLITLGPCLLRAVRGVLGHDHPDTQDVTQEAAVALLEGLRTYRGDASVAYFASQVAMLTAMTAHRRAATAKRSRLDPCSVDPKELASQSSGPDQGVLARDAREAVRALLATLPAAQAEVLGLHCVLGFTATEMSKTLGLASETVRSRLKLARRALRLRLQGNPALREIIEGAS
jgi:RNA polymerase sigma factor (sigma-70 family)